MAITELENYNRIINLTFKTASGSNNITIECPLRGRKPDIEIIGTYTTAGYLPAFNVTVKNLHLDLSGEQYNKLEVQAGYGSRLQQFTGTIISMYQESPGPDGKTIIQCQQGNIEKWLDANVDINQPAGTPCSLILSEIAKALDLTPEPKETAMSITTPGPFVFQGKAAAAITHLKKTFEEYRLLIQQRENALYCTSLKNKEKLGERVINFLSAPPQQNTGDENGAYFTTITAPWIPDLAIQDEVLYPSWQYMKNFQMVNKEGAYSKLIVTGLSFHFGTTGGVNSMTVQGYGG